MDDLIEKLVCEVESQIRLDFADMVAWTWTGVTVDTPVPDRHSKSFVDMAMSRLVLRRGFSTGTRLAFEIEQYLKKGN